jgi:hypothetical protein
MKVGFGTIISERPKMIASSFFPKMLCHLELRIQSPKHWKFTTLTTGKNHFTKLMWS